MTVAELIRRLESFDPAAPVEICVISGSGGYLAEALDALLIDGTERIRIFGERTLAR